MCTSRAEYRLILRQDNSDERLMPIGYRLGTISAERYDERRRFWDRKREAAAMLGGIKVVPAEYQAATGGNISMSASALDILRRPEVGISGLMRGVKAVADMFSCRTDGEDGASDCDVSDGAKLGIDAGDMLSGGSDGGPGDISAVETIDRYLALGVESDIKYEGFVRKQIREIDRVRRYEEAKIPDDFSYDNVPGLLTESRQKLKKIRPSTLGGASRISGVTPADVSVLAMYLLKSG